ncbi:unnamed protein product [Diamesa hyperborea]
MGAMEKIIFGAITLAIAFGFQAYRDMSKSMEKPDLDVNEYWGPGDVKGYKEDKTIRAFKVDYTDEVISRLKSKLNDVEPFTKPLEGTAFEYGFNTKKASEIIDYWKGSYLTKWSERQNYLNKLPQFTTQIQGLKIHYIHVKPNVAADVKVYPLLLLHGWPGTVREFYDIIPLLTKPSNDKIAFEVIAPSLPGYGWSQGASKEGLGCARIAVIMNNLMKRLGIEKFYIQGGDWGSLIGSDIASLFPENVMGYHSNMCAVQSPLAMGKGFVASFYPKFFMDAEFVEWSYPFMPKFFELVQESGYMHIQSTKPDTIGTALHDNPVGLAVYIMEKFSTWTNPDYRKLKDGGLEKYFTMDALLDNVMIYYLTNSITTSVRIYKESFSSREMSYQMDRVPVTVPSGCAHFRYELVHQAEFILKERFVNMVHSSRHADGGHFASMQLPKVMYKDILEFVRKTL